MATRASPKSDSGLDIRCDGCTHFLIEIEENEGRLKLRLPCRSCNLDNHVELNGMTVVGRWTTPKAAKIKTAASGQTRTWTQ